MKKILVFAAAVFVCTTAAAQNKDKMDCGKAIYIQPPSDMTLQQYKTFYVDASVPDNNANLKDLVYKASELEGFTRSEIRELGEYIVNYTVYPLETEAPKENSQTTVSESNGVKTSTTTYYWSSPYIFRITVKVFTRDGTAIYSDECKENGHLSSESFIKSSDALKNYNELKPKRLADLVNQGVRKLRGQMAAIYCYLTVERTVDAIMVKAKKFNYDGFNKGVALITEAVSLQSAEKKATDKVKSLCAEAIALWNTDLQESNLEDKKARINPELTAALYYNIGLASFIAEDYQTSYDYFTKASEIEKNVTTLHQTWTSAAKEMVERSVNKI